MSSEQQSYNCIILPVLLMWQYMLHKILKTFITHFIRLGITLKEIYYTTFHTVYLQNYLQF